MLAETEGMRALNKRKVRWIVRQIEKGELSIYRIAKMQGISPRHARRIYCRYRGKSLYKPDAIQFKRPERAPRPIEDWEKELILGICKSMPMGAVSIEKMLRQTKKELRLPHNRIHKILLELCLAKTEPKKSRRRKWVRYERRHPNSLWHTDWLEYKDDFVIAFEDDASRLITGFGIFKNATSENSVSVLKKAVAEWGKPKQLMSDHGVQFTTLERTGCEEPGENAFQKALGKMEIEHIKARVKHPQSNGKVERLFGTLKKFRDFYGSWEEAVRIYNFKRPHMSLEKDDGTLRTPYQAFLEKKKG